MPAAKKTTTAVKKETAAAAKKTATAAKKPAAKTTTTAAKKPAVKTAAKKTSTTAKKTTIAAKKTTTAAKKPAAKKTSVPAGANSSMKVTATEKKLVETYRGASADLKKIAMKVLKGEYSEKSLKLLDMIGGGLANAPESLGDGIGSILGNLFKGK